MFLTSERNKMEKQVEQQFQTEKQIDQQKQPLIRRPQSNTVAMANRISRMNHQFADDIGGCSANYRGW